MLGVPKAFLQGPYPGFYITPPKERYKYGGLQAAFETESESEVNIVITFKTLDVPAPEEPYFFIQTIARDIRQKIMQDTADGIYQDDGDVGFRCEVVSTEYSFEPTEPVIVANLSMVIGQYTQ
jgi:hypothetical protein